MEHDVLKQLAILQGKADQYHRQALWQEKLRILQDINGIHRTLNIAGIESRRQDNLLDHGAVRRRLGQYEVAEILLRQALDIDARPLKRASILGELTVVLRQQNRYHDAMQASLEQYQLALEAHPSLEAEIEACRAIGNVGMSRYNISQGLDADDATLAALLQTAEENQLERIERARSLQDRVGTGSKWSGLARAWETIGMDRLTLVYLAQDRVDEAVRLAKETQAKQNVIDPTVTAFSKWFYGNALWRAGRQAEAKEQWSANKGICNSVIALCKEPCLEHNRYVAIMVHAGVDVDCFDEQGFSALDYAVMSDAGDAKDIVQVLLEALCRQYATVSEDNESLARTMAIDRLRQAKTRRQYRDLFQEKLRPRLTSQVMDKLSPRQAIDALRQEYETFLLNIPRDEQMLWPFQFVRYTDFKAHGRLPISSDRLTRERRSNEDVFVIFISYRWRGGSMPDDDLCTQWHKICGAVEAYLSIRQDIKIEHIAIWLDYACIDQVNLERKVRGVNALPIAVTLCDAMISLIDDEYYQRAWCAVEVVLMESLTTSYNIHQRWEYGETDDGLKLQRAAIGKTLPPDRLTLSHEIEDRPKIDFLMRQSSLLGSDRA